MAMPRPGKTFLKRLMRENWPSYLQASLLAQGLELMMYYRRMKYFIGESSCVVNYGATKDPEITKHNKISVFFFFYFLYLTVETQLSK